MRIIRFILAVTLLAWATSLPAQYSGGDGSPETPYRIATAEDLQALAADPCHWQADFRLEADLDLGTLDPMGPLTIGTDGNHPFTGRFDDNGRTLRHYQPAPDANDFIGLFGYIRGDRAKIFNLTLADPCIDAPDGRFVGALVGVLESGFIHNCAVVGGAVNGTHAVGALAGYSSGVLSFCTIDGTAVTATNYAGGLVGQNYGTVDHARTRQAQVGAASRAGGVAGANYQTIIVAAAGGMVWANDTAGGLVGDQLGLLHHVYADAVVTADDKAGGLAGSVTGTVYRAYSNGAVSGQTRIGGFIGQRGTTAQLLACFWGRAAAGIQLGVGQGSEAGLHGLDTVALNDPNTYLQAGWDFVAETANGPSDIWAAPGGSGPPQFWFEMDPWPALPHFAGGAGTPADPYRIVNAADLNAIGYCPRLMTACFRLENALDLDAVAPWPIGTPGLPFRGRFEGQQHPLQNYRHTGTDTQNVGLFRVIDTPAVLENIILADPCVSSPAATAVAVLAGRVDGGLISGCRVLNGTVQGQSSVGSLVGYLAGGTVDAAAADGLVTGELSVGGLIGRNSGHLRNSSASATVNGLEAVGGLAGENLLGGVIEHCRTDAVVSGAFTVGGLVGANAEGSISRCYATGTAAADSHAGGLVGQVNWLGVIDQCYATAVASAPEAAGTFAGGNWGSLSACFAASATAPPVGEGLADGVVALSAAQLAEPTPYLAAGWQWVAPGATASGWTLCPQDTQPRLNWEYASGDLVCPRGIDLLDIGALAAYWLNGDCQAVDCQGSDIDGNGSVDAVDLVRLVDGWLR